MTGPMTSPQHALESQPAYRGPVLAAGLTPGAARAARAEYARVAELNAYRYEHALAARRYSLAARAEREYRHAARFCHALGELQRIDGAADAPQPVRPSRFSTMPARELTAAVHAVLANGRVA
jgi:hypothetical protein